MRIVFPALCMALLTAASQATKPVRPNVLLIVMDDIADREMDRVNTPAFDGLAARGMRFRRAYAAPVCSPSRRMLNFGNYWYHDSGHPCSGRNFPSAQPSPDAISLPRMFSDAGYSTALIGKWHLGSFPGVDQGEAWQLAPIKHGFHTWRAGMSANVRSSCISKGTYLKWQRIDDLKVSVCRQYNTDAIRDASLEWLAERKEQAQQPWFGMVCFQGAHGPFKAPPGTWEEGRTFDRRAFYELMIENLDQAIAAILEEVDLSQTVVLLVGDNGTPRIVSLDKEKGRGKTTTLEGGIHVPMVWAGAGVACLGESLALVSFVDVLPTMAALIGYESPGVSALDGISIQNVLKDPSQPAHDFIWSGCEGANIKTGSDYAVVTERWKLRLVSGETEHYDLKLDPDERTNLADPERDSASNEEGIEENQYKSVINKLRRLLVETRRRVYNR